jgi:intracellular multiplication protein IcmC
MTDASPIGILNNIANSLLPIERLVTGAAYLMGLGFAIKALMTLKSHSESRGQSAGGGGNSMKEPLVYLLVAGMLVYFPTGFEVLMNTTFGYGNVLAYAPVNSSSPVLNSLFGSDSEVGYALSLFIQTIGVFAFVKGWVLIARSAGHGQQPGGAGKGLMHVFGGILAMNIIGTLEVINNTLYGVS